MKRISSGLIIIFSLVFAVLLVYQNTTYASWLQVTSGNIGIGYSDLADTISFKEYDKTIKIKIGNHLFNNANTLYIYKDDQKIDSIAIPVDLKKYTIKQIEDVDTGRVFYIFNSHLDYPPAFMMGYDSINKKWQVYINSTSNSFPSNFRRLAHPSFYVNDGNLYFRYAFDHFGDPTPPDAIYSLVWDAGANWIGYSLL